MVRVGNTTFNEEALKDMTKTEFTKKYKGLLNVDMKEALKAVRKYLKK